MTNAFGILGAKGAGKDTCAAYLCEKHGYVRIAFADPLYGEVAKAFSVTANFLGNRELKESPRAELSLERCPDQKFVNVVLSATRSKESGLSRAQRMAKPRSAREVLQMWGTEYRRAQNPSYWTDQVKNTITSNPETRYVLSDVRFRNEYDCVLKAGGKFIRVLRPLLDIEESAQRQVGGTAAHASETELLDAHADHVITNEEGQLEQLHRAIDAFATKPKLVA